MNDIFITSFEVKKVRNIENFTILLSESDILQMLAEGVSSEEILQDIQACLFYAARRVDFERLAA